MKGFYKDNENEKNETINTLKKIKEYQGEFPEIIKTNLNVEIFLYTKKYLEVKNINAKLIDIFNEFTSLFGFAKQHQDFILYILDLPENANSQMINEKIKELLVVKHFDVGVKVFQRFINSTENGKIIDIIPSIIWCKNISFDIKALIMKKIYEFLNYL